MISDDLCSSGHVSVVMLNNILVLSESLPFKTKLICLVLLSTDRSLPCHYLK